MARILICGTLAYDDIGTFTSTISAGTRNVKLDRLHRGFGGCAMNIAYNLAGLGHQPVPFVYAGDDYSGDYARHVAAAGISESGIFRISGTQSARGIILTGSDGVQFTAFYPGPSGLARWARDLDEVLSDGAFDAAILAPDLPRKMAGCAARLHHLPLKVGCPGQYAELLPATDVTPVLEHLDLLVVNRHEWDALCATVDAAEILRHSLEVIVTDGAGPVHVLRRGIEVPVPALPKERQVDPTGCGDAFVAALTGCLLENRSLDAAVAAGVRLAGLCMSQWGAQSHAVDATAEI